MKEIFVGRKNELNKLLSIWNEILDHSSRTSRVIFVTGEAGAGKTKLISQFIQVIQQQATSKNNIWIGNGTCEIFEEAQIAYLPFFQVLESFKERIPIQSKLKKLERYNQTVSQIAPSWFKMLPVIGDPLSTTIEGIRHLQEKKKEKEAFAPSKQPDVDIFAQYLRVLENMTGSSDEPMLVVLDDLQWADQSSLQLLSYLGQKIPQSQTPILIIGAYRVFESQGMGARSHRVIDEMVLRLEQRKLCHKLFLQTFSMDEVEEFIRKLYAAKDSLSINFPTEFGETIFAQTSGNPLFIAELLQNLEEKGSIVHDQAEWRVADFESIFEEMPNSLQAVLEERIGRLEKSLRDFLTIASIEGENFTAQVLSRVKKVEITTLLDILVQELSKKYGLVSELEEKEIAYRRYLTLYTFKHGLIRDFIYNQLSNAQKRIFHQQVGECLEDLYGEEKVELVALQLARHFWIAKDYPKIAQYGLLAAQQEFDKFATHQTVWWCKNVINVLIRFPDVPNPISNEQLLQDAYLLEVEAHVHLGENDEAYDTIKVAMQRTDTSSIWNGKLSYWQGEVLLRWGRYDESLKSLNASLQVARKLGYPESEASVLRFLGYVHAVKGDFNSADEYWRQGLEIVNEIDAPYVKALIWSDTAVFSNDRGDLPKSAEAAKTALEIYQKIGSKRGETMSLRTLADVKFLRGDLAEAEALVRRATDLALEIDDAIYIVWCTLNLVRCLIARNKYSDAEPLAHDSLKKCLDMKESGFIPDAYIFLSQIELNKSNYDLALHFIDSAIDSVADEDVWTWCHAYYVKGNVQIAQGLIAEAEVCMQKAYEKAHSGNTKLMAGYTSLEYAKSSLLSGKIEKALRLANEAKELFSEIGIKLRLEDSLALITKIENSF